MTRLLEITDLHVALPPESQRPYAVQGMNLTLEDNEIVCVVGESGSGKSLTARAVMDLLPKPRVQVSQGSILFQGEDLTQASDERMRKIRGSDISMIFQEPMTALNPVMTIGNQIDEVFRFHEKMPGKERRARALGLLEDVQLPDPEQALKAYPHELSGGQRQRAMIAMALALDPKILIADEPTTALDVTTQAQVLKLIKQMQETHGTGVLFITHDFGVVADIADRVAVMQNGLVVETGTTDQVLRSPTHPYTQALIGSVPDLIPRPARPRSSEIVLRVNKLEKTYRGGGGLFGGKERVVHAANDVTLDLARGETLGIVGESGSGKSTVARCIVRLNDAEAGEILLGDTDLRPLGRAAMRPHRSKIQMVFQDPYASLNPRTRIGKIIAQGPMMYGASAEEARKRTVDLLEIVGLDAGAYDRFPHEFSGGQRQRIGIARALALEPDILVADEPVSALDVSIQAQILNLLDEIRDRMNLSMIFITHDLRVAAQVCDRIAVMQRGKVIEVGPTSELFANPTQSYTQELLAAVPGKDWFSTDIVPGGSAPKKKRRTPLDPDAPYPSVAALAEAYLDGSARPSHVTRAHLDRIERLDPKIRAFQAIYAEDAMRLAEAADRMFDAGQSLGPFHGIPFGLKDICDVEGRVTTGGSQAMAARISPVTGTLTHRLFAAGGIMLGKTKTVECAFGGWGTNQHMGTPQNPWDMEVARAPGGSSSGTGASIAAGLAACGVGTDTGGSVRLPAAFCGLVGLKVTEGRLPTDGILPLSQTLDTPGPLARSVEDVILMLSAMDGTPGWQVARDWREGSGLFASLSSGITGLRLGVLDGAERDACAPDVLAAYDAALTVLRGLGAELVPFSAPQSYADLTATCGTLIATEAYANHGALYEQADMPLDEDVRARMLSGREVTAAAYRRDLAERAEAKANFLNLMHGFDALLTPSTTTVAPPLNEIDQAVSPGYFARHVNYFGLCALSVPSGLSEGGLPTGLQIVARPNAEAMALRIGASYQDARAPMRYPELR